MQWGVQCSSPLVVRALSVRDLIVRDCAAQCSHEQTVRVCRRSGRWRGAQSSSAPGRGRGVVLRHGDPRSGGCRCGSRSWVGIREVAGLRLGHVLQSGSRRPGSAGRRQVVVGAATSEDGWTGASRARGTSGPLKCTSPFAKSERNGTTGSGPPGVGSSLKVSTILRRPRPWNRTARTASARRRRGLDGCAAVVLRLGVAEAHGVDRDPASRQVGHRQSGRGSRH